MKLQIIHLAFAVAIAGCGRDSSSAKGSSKEPPKAGAQAAGLTKACEVMARADAEAAAGLPLPQTVETVPKHEWEVASCSYMSPDYYSVELIVRDWEGLQPGMKLDGEHKPLIAIGGLGDEAWASDKGIEYTRLYVRKGNRGIGLTMNSPPIRALEDKGLSRAKILAGTIVPKI